MVLAGTDMGEVPHLPRYHVRHRNCRAVSNQTNPKVICVNPQLDDGLGLSQPIRFSTVRFSIFAPSTLDLGMPPSPFHPSFFQLNHEHLARGFMPIRFPAAHHARRLAKLQ
jgi:hypothetical protein